MLASVFLARLHCCIWRAPIPGTHSRLLLASDGLWDVLSPTQACRLVRGAATAQRAADLLLGMAERISNEKRGRTVIRWHGAAEETDRIAGSATLPPSSAAQMAARPATGLRGAPLLPCVCAPGCRPR